MKSDERQKEGGGGVVEDEVSKMSRVSLFGLLFFSISFNFIVVFIWLFFLRVSILSSIFHPEIHLFSQCNQVKRHKNKREIVCVGRDGWAEKHS